ncbi:MAG: glycoside hydrolase family 32 protein [Phycisphaerae bacterium]
MNWMFQKPTYHFVPLPHFPDGTHFQDVMPFYARGVYHSFYQCRSVYGTDLRSTNCLATSRDLVHWVDQGIVLSPDPEGPDSNGCWTGCVVENAGTFYFFYTGVAGPKYINTQCLATSRDLLHWDKFPQNPIIGIPPEGVGLSSFRDPCVWKENDEWCMAVGASLREVGCVLLYRSRDLIRWEYCHVLWTGTPEKPGAMCECPDLFPLEDRYVLLTLGVTFKRTWYMTGWYRRQRYEQDIWGCADYGDFFAAKTLVDDKGRRICWGWIPETYGTSYMGFETTGVQSLPRLLSLRTDGSLGMEPVSEVQALRDRVFSVKPLRIPEKGCLSVPEIQGDCLEIEAEIAAGDAEECGLLIRCTPDYVEQTRIVYNRKKKSLGLDRSRSSLDPLARCDLLEGKLSLEEGENLKLRIFMDRSVVEIFANGRACITGRIYPSRQDSQGLGLFAESGGAAVTLLRAWLLKTPESCVTRF